MSDLRKAAQQALEFIESVHQGEWSSFPHGIDRDAIAAALRAALAAQPAREPTSGNEIVAIVENSYADLFLTELIPIFRAVERHHGIRSKG